jgi:hypothetical protein
MTVKEGRVLRKENFTRMKRKGKRAIKDLDAEEDDRHFV